MSVQPKPMTEDQIENIARFAVREAVDFMDSEIAPDRIKAQRYYDGEVDIGETDGRSKVVATKVRDTVRAIKPSLMRVFLSTDKPVEFTPKRPSMARVAELQTKGVTWSFYESNGYRVLNDAIHDALIKKVGIVKAYWKQYDEQEFYEMENVSELELAALVEDDNVRIASQETEITIEIDEQGVEIERPIHKVSLYRQEQRGKLCIESIPPEEFFVDRNAVSIDDCYCVGHRTEMRVSDLVEMGFAFEDVVDLGSLQDDDSYADAERFERSGYEDEEEAQQLDPSMRVVAVTECYMKMDVQGTGIASLHKIILGGGSYKLLDVEPVSRIPFAKFEVDPEAHTFFGRSIADLIINEQDAATAMLRGVLDNIGMTNNPAREVVDSMVNMDDVLNNEFGAIIRVDQPNMIRDLAVPFFAGQVLPALQYFDQVIEEKTGVTKASTGLSPDALQSTTAAAVNATVSANAAQVETMARNLAEGGMAQLFKIMLKIMVENADDEMLMRLSGDEFVPLDPRSWDTSMDVCVNVGLGTGKEDQKAAALMQTLQMQMQVVQTYGLGNGFVSLSNIRNTLADLNVLAGIRNTDRYYAPITPEYEQQLVAMQQQQQQMAQQQGDPQAQAFIEAETIKARARLEAEAMKNQANSQNEMLKLQLEAQRALADDDRQRDKMDQDLIVKAAEIIGKYGTQVDIERIKAMQAMPRYPDQAPAQAVTGARY